MIIRIPSPFRKKKPLESSKKQPPTLIMAIDQYMSKQGDWKVKVCHVSNKDRLNPSSLVTTTVKEFVSVMGDVDAFIREEYGAGKFRIEIYDLNGQLQAEYPLNVGGPKAYREVGVGLNKGGNGEGSIPGGLAGLAGTVQLVKSLIPERDPMMEKVMLKFIENGLNQGPSSSDELVHNWMTIKINNEMDEKSNVMSTMRDMAEMSQLFAPKIAPDNTINALIQAVPEALKGFAMMKGGSMPPPAPYGVSALPVSTPPGNGSVDMAKLQQAVLSLPEEVIMQFPPDQANEMMKLRSAGVPGGASVLPRPGAPVGAPAVPPEVLASAGVGAAPESPTPGLAGSGAYHKAIDAMLEGIRVDLRGEATDRDVAQKMISMISAARGFTDADPHPILKGIMEAGPETANAEFTRFCQAIPELGRDSERIASIADEIDSVIADSVADMTDVGPPTAEETEAQAPVAEAQAPLDLEFAYETTADQVAAMEDQDDGRNAPGSSGLPGDTETPAETVGSGQNTDRDDGEEPGEADRKAASAA